MFFIVKIFGNFSVLLKFFQKRKQSKRQGLSLGGLGRWCGSDRTVERQLVSLSGRGGEEWRGWLRISDGIKQRRKTGHQESFHWSASRILSPLWPWCLPPSYLKVLHLGILSCVADKQASMFSSGGKWTKPQPESPGATCGADNQAMPPNRRVHQGV